MKSILLIEFLEYSEQLRQSRYLIVLKIKNINKMKWDT